MTTDGNSCEEEKSFGEVTISVGIRVKEEITCSWIIGCYECVNSWIIRLSGFFKNGIREM